MIEDMMVSSEIFKIDLSDASVELVGFITVVVSTSCKDNDGNSAELQQLS